MAKTSSSPRKAGGSGKPEPATSRLGVSTKGKRKKRLTATETRVVEAAIAHPEHPQRLIAIAAGFPPGDAGRVQTSRILKNPLVQETMAEMMEKRPNLRRKALLDRLEEGLNATKVERAVEKGEFTDEKVDPDFPTRERYLKIATTISGDLTKKIEVSSPGGKSLLPDPLTKIIEAMSTDQLQELVTRCLGK